MINPYCSPLHGLFAELSYYGLLKAEDTQCLRADVAVEPSFYVLFCATLLLSLLNSFVTKANAHYLHDKEWEEADVANTRIPSASPGINRLDDLSDYEAHSSREGDRTIRPVPVLFSDRFRWFLLREDTHSSTDGSFDERMGRQVETPDEPEFQVVRPMEVPIEPEFDTQVLWTGKASDQGYFES